MQVGFVRSGSTEALGGIEKSETELRRDYGVDGQGLGPPEHNEATQSGRSTLVPLRLAPLPMTASSHASLAYASMLVLTPLVGSATPWQEEAREIELRAAEAIEHPRFQSPAEKAKRIGAKAFESSQLALAWLVAHQSNDGSWNRDGEANEEASFAATSLALLALVGDGQTTKRGEHAAAVRAATSFLSTPNIDRGGAREQGIGLCALAELHRFDPEAVPLEFLSQRVEAVLALRRPEGPWGGPQDEQPSAVASAWCCAGLVIAGEGAVPLATAGLDPIGAWFESLADETGKVEIETPSGAPEHGAAVCLLPQLLVGQTIESAPRLKLMAERLALPEAQPQWDQDDFESWYSATTGLQMLDDETARGWYDNVCSMLFANQLEGGAAPGSWTAVGYTPERGAVRSTAMAALILQSPLRAPSLRVAAAKAAPATSTAMPEPTVPEKGEDQSR